MTTIIENARLELLRCAAYFRDSGQGRPHWPTHFPLMEEDEWNNTFDDIKLACREAAALGQIEWHPHGSFYAMVRITDAGYDWIRAHDVLGEIGQAPQEAA